jgi:hypothetical protein
MLDGVDEVLVAVVYRMVFRLRQLEGIVCRINYVSEDPPFSNGLRIPILLIPCLIQLGKLRKWRYHQSSSEQFFYSFKGLALCGFRFHSTREGGVPLLSCDEKGKRKDGCSRSLLDMYPGESFFSSLLIWF